MAAMSSITICSAGTFKPLAKACQALAAELQSALQQQQQQPVSSLKGGFLSAGKRKQQSKKAPKQQQQHQRRASDSFMRGLTLGRVLITLWQALVQMPAGSNYHHTLFSNADQCASVLPAVKLMLVLLRAQQQHTIPTSSASSSSSSSSSRGGSGSSSSGATEWSWMVGSDEPANQIQAALSAASTLAEAIAMGLREQESLQSLPGVMQLLATPDLHQLLITAVARLTGLLHQQKQGMSGVPVESVLRCLGNTNAAAAVTLDDDSSSSSSSDASAASPGSSSRVPTHHSKVLELLQASAADPLHGCGSADSQQPSSTLKALTASDAAPTSMADRLAAALIAAAFCLEIRRSSRGGWLIGGSGDDAVSYGAVQMAFLRPDSSRRSNSNSSSSSRGSGEDARAWRQPAPAVARMLVSAVQMAPVGRVGDAAVTMLQSVVLRDTSAV
jgi:hypothetical protein